MIPGDFKQRKKGMGERERKEKDEAIEGTKCNLEVHLGRKGNPRGRERVQRVMN